MGLLTSAPAMRTAWLYTEVRISGKGPHNAGSWFAYHMLLLPCHPEHSSSKGGKPLLPTLNMTQGTFCNTSVGGTCVTPMLRG